MNATYEMVWRSELCISYYALHTCPHHILELQNIIEVNCKIGGIHCWSCKFEADLLVNISVIPSGVASRR